MNTNIKHSIKMLLITKEPKAKYPKPCKRRAPKRIGKPQQRKTASNGIFDVM